MVVLRAFGGVVVVDQSEASYADSNRGAWHVESYGFLVAILKHNLISQINIYSVQEQFDLTLISKIGVRTVTDTT